MSTDVYFSSIQERSRTDCFRTLLKHIDGMLSQFKKGSFVGIKMTVGDKKNTGYIKPDLVKILVENLKRRGAKPFVFDTNVIYKGQRQNAVDHLNLAYKKGFTPDRLGCPFIIADSVFGTDSTIVKVDYKNIKELRVPSLVRVLEDLIVLSHITGHIMSGYAASIKNVGMGMASRAGKQIQHSSMKPLIDAANCTLCGCCIENCPVSAISEMRGKAYINSERCIGCGECIACCKFDAVHIHWHEDESVFGERMVEYASGILSHIKRKVFMDFAFDITEECDCISGNDPKVAEDAGIFASTDILAADKAAFDMLTKSMDMFSRDGKIRIHAHQFEYAEKTGLGKLNYKLVEVI
ncbi:MAG: DUF362 domain-containing protein [Nitrospiraceae bacterium]|nr:MAG: DUF362 domain-containing protein [Nitrospiraceae bacterium]